ncbi:T9SS type A sorting domain-containing protein, partial [bacterium]|nr:T9SS type A sorting domain-containing protein [bacterium]
LMSSGNTYITGIDAELAAGSPFEISLFPQDSIAAYGMDSVVISFVSAIDSSGEFLDTLIIHHDRGEAVRIPLTAEVVSGTVDKLTLIPSEYYLKQNYPNPFNPATTLEFGLPVTSDISLKVYDLQGRLVDEIINSSLAAGRHAVQWECRSCASGLYMFVLEVGEMQFVRKGMLLK